MPWISLAFFLANTWMWLETYVRKKFEKSQLHPVSTQLENIAAWTNQNFCLVLDKKKPLFWDHSFHWFFFSIKKNIIIGTTKKKWNSQAGRGTPSSEFLTVSLDTGACKRKTGWWRKTFWKVTITDVNQPSWSQREKYNFSLRNLSIFLLIDSFPTLRVETLSWL